MPTSEATAEASTEATPVTTPAIEPPPTPTSTPTPTPSAKPTKKPTPTPSPTPKPTKIDLAILVMTDDLPNPWYNNTDYKIPIHVSVAGSDVPPVTVKVSIPQEQFSVTYQTGPISDGSEDVHDVTINVPAIGPATLTLAVKTPPGFTDIVPANNKVQISIEIQLAP